MRVLYPQLLLLSLTGVHGFQNPSVGLRTTRSVDIFDPFNAEELEIAPRTSVPRQGVAVAGVAIPTATLLSAPMYAHAADFSAAVAARPVLDIFVNVMSLLFICRIVMSWYPKTDTTVFPYNAITWPTEPLLAPARAILPPAFGVDISAIVWVMLLSLVREVLTGQQGILTLLEKGA
jgi:YggT family protein